MKLAGSKFYKPLLVLLAQALLDFTDAEAWQREFRPHLVYSTAASWERIVLRLQERIGRALEKARGGLVHRPPGL